MKTFYVWLVLMLCVIGCEYQMHYESTPTQDIKPKQASDRERCDCGCTAQWERDGATSTCKCNPGGKFYGKCPGSIGLDAPVVAKKPTEKEPKEFLVISKGISRKADSIGVLYSYWILGEYKTKDWVGPNTYIEGTKQKHVEIITLEIWNKLEPGMIFIDEL